MTKPLQQGKLDGLCGIYSLINSIHYLNPHFNEDDCTKLFEFLIKAGGDLFPKAIYDGLNFHQLSNIAEKMAEHLSDKMTLSISRPNYRKHVDSVEEFLEEIDLLMKNKKAVTLVGLGKPWDHWTVISKILPKSIVFQDSYGIKRWNKSALSLVNSATTTRLDYHQTFLIIKEKP